MGIELVKAATITRPADTTAYASGDLIANSTTAGSVTPFTFAGGAVPYRARRFILRTSNATVTNKNYQLFLFSASPTVTNGDNGAFAVTAADHGRLVGVFASTAALSTGGGSVNYFYCNDSAATSVNGWLESRLPGTFYGLLRANAAYTPTSAETFDLVMEGSLDGPYG